MAEPPKREPDEGLLIELMNRNGDAATLGEVVVKNGTGEYDSARCRGDLLFTT